MWKSAPEIQPLLKSLPDSSRLKALYSLSVFWRRAFYTEGYRAADEWASMLTLTHEGEAVLAELLPGLTGIARADVMLAYFIRFFHHDVFVDLERNDPARIRQILERELFQGRVRFPHRFGRALYDRFNDNGSNTRTDHLMGPDAERLLLGTPIGIYQLENLVTGPLGIVDSLESRILPPSRYLPLWHCSDTGCRTLHSVRLVQPSVPVIDADSRIAQTLSDRFGPASEWDDAFAFELQKEGPRDYVDLLALLADCIIGRERTTLVEYALAGARGDHLRSILSSPPRRRREGEGSAIEVAKRLEPEAQLQLLLVLPDHELVNVMDDALLSKAIKIPLGEIREVAYETPRGVEDSGSQLSVMGIRSAKENPVVNLIAAVWKAYQQLGLTNELEWRVRSDSAGSPYEALVAFVRNRGPAETIRELVLSSGGITRTVCDRLRVPIKHATGTDGPVIDRLLWKLGFNLMQFDDSIPRFKSRLAEFNETILANSPIESEDARERVRAAGVNVFVSLEDFTDRFVSYNVWLLSSDHFVGTKFRYSSAEARRAVGRTLGGSLSNAGATVSWNDTGENALGTLLRYLRALADWLGSLPEEDRNQLKRPEQDLPHFAESEYLHFPFRHTALWADSDPSELRRHAELCSRIVKLIEESDPASVRNGLDHFREPDRFPIADRLLGCVARLIQALELADVHRFLPKVFWLFGRKGNRFGSVEYEYRDYAGRALRTYGPPLLSGVEAPSYKHACLLPPGNLLGTPNNSLVFQLEEPSEFSMYWHDYPRRRKISAENVEQSSAQQAPLAPNPPVPGSGEPTETVENTSEGNGSSSNHNRKTDI
jgi:hypothetical protein